MPIYEYRCRKCTALFERLVPMDSAAPACPSCGANASERRVALVARVAGGGAAVGCACGGGGCACGGRAN